MTLEQRVAKLERTNNRLRLAVAGLFAASLALVSLGVSRHRDAPDLIPNLIRAKALHIVDDEGRVRIGLDVGQDGTASVYVSAEHHTSSGGLTCSKDGVELSLRTRRGPQIRLASGRNKAQFELADKQGEPLARLGTLDNRASLVFLNHIYSSNRKPVWTAP